MLSAMAKAFGAKSAQVRDLLGRGLAAADIAKRVGCTVGLVYNIRSRMGRAKPRTAARGRPARNAQSNGLDGIIESVRRTEQERRQLRAKLDAVAKIVADVL